MKEAFEGMKVFFCLLWRKNKIEEKQIGNNTIKNKGGDKMARRRKKNKSGNSGSGIILFIILLIAVFQWAIPFVTTHIFAFCTILCIAVAMYVYFKIRKRKQVEWRRQELLKYNSEVQRKVINNMISSINDMLRFEKYNLSAQEKQKKRKIKEQYYQYQKQLTTSFVYIIQEEANGYIKIGKANDPIDRIVRGLGAKTPYKMRVLHLIPTHLPFEVEKWFHTHYEKKRLNGEWFHLSPQEVQHIQSGNYSLELLELIVGEKKNV